MRLRRSVVLAATAVFLHAPGAEAQSATAPVPSAAPLMALIDSFIARPFGHPALRTALIDSAEARPDVAITLSDSVAPYLLERDTTVFRRGMRALFLSGFVAGNMRAQLLSGQKGDRPYAGTQVVLRFYQLVREKRPEYHLAILDAWLTLDHAGTLEAHLREAATAMKPGKS